MQTNSTRASSSAVNVSCIRFKIPDDKHSRLKELAQHKHLSINKLIEELSTVAITEFDNESQFYALAANGNVTKGLSLLDKIDKHFSN